MGKNVTVNLFQVEYSERSQKLSETLREFERLPIDERWRSDIRLDRVTQVQSAVELPVEVFHLDFAKRREVGPGRVSHGQPVTDVVLHRDEDFGEETAALYVPKKKWLLVLNNQFGVGPSRMAEYFNALDPGNNNRHFDYQISPMLESGVLERLKAMTHFAHVEVTATVGAFENGSDAMAEPVAAAAQAARAVRVHLKLSANEPHQRGQSLDLQAVLPFIRKMLRQSDEVAKLEVKGGDEQAYAKDQVINLIEQKVKQRFPASELTVVHHRYTFSSRIEMLKRACRGWLRQLG